MKKVGLILFASLMLTVFIANSTVVVITKPQLPSVFRAPSNFDMQAEQWLYKATDNFFLLGGESRGTLYAAYHFLEDVHGVRWWTSWGEESVPASMATISASPTLAGIPAFSYRESHNGLDDATERPFFAKNRCNGRMSFLGINYGWNETFGLPSMVHSFGRYIPADTYFASHPEYFALVGGVRNPEQLCMSNTSVYNIILAQLTQYIENDRAAALDGGHPMPRYYDLSQNDGFLYCQCTTCAALIQAQGNAPSAPIIDFVNRIARAIKTTYPEVTLSTLAYQVTEKPPSTLQVEDNVTIRIAGALNNFAKPFSDSANASFNSHVQGWSNLAKNLYFWHYQTTYSYNAAHNFVTANLANDLRYCRDNNAKGFFLEHENYKFPEVAWELDTWLSLKLMENPDLSIDTLIDTFCTGYYGATAGAAIRQYISQIQAAAASNSDFHTFSSIVLDYSYINCAFVAAAHQHWAAAEAGATGVQLQRVKNARLGFDRYVLHAGQRLLDEYAAAHGGSVANFSADVINLYQAAQRSITTLNSLPTDRFPISDALPSGGFTTAVKNAEIAEMNAFSTNFQTISANPALPSQIADSPVHFVYYPVELSSTPGSDWSLVTDSLTARLSTLMTWSYNGGVYNTSTQGGFAFSIPTISNTAYQWYQMGTGTISSSDYMYLLNSWNVKLFYGTKVLSTGRTNGTFWGEFRKKDSTHVYLNRVAIVFN